MPPPITPDVAGAGAMRAARYAVGIDLGTSHTVTAALALNARVPQPALLAVPQRNSAGEVVATPLLPSLRYQAGADELGAAWQQPWPPLGATARAPAVLGRWARDLGAAVPARLVSSAKSWLSHPGVDRQAPILPWGAPDADDAGGGVAKISPLLASASYLAQVRQAWDHAYPDAPLAQQRVVLTVPASFDEGARALTLEAAALAGLPPLQLLEEPKAAFQDWLALQGPALAAELAGCRRVLVVDMGGGTTDLTLIQVTPDAAGGMPTLTRSAVGEHLMLGGDNMDLALAHLLEAAFAGPGQRLPALRFAQLVQRCRAAKEQLLAADAPAQVPITLLGAGSRLLAHSQSSVLSAASVREQVLEGFFPLVAPDARPARRQGALRGLGLPYPGDAAISRHLAAFLAQHAADGWPDALLLNGGVFHAEALRQRLCEQLAQWRGQPLRLLHNPHPDWAVARGAALHGWRQHRVEGDTPASGSASAATLPGIGGGSARSYWLQLADGAMPQCICVLPRGQAEGEWQTLAGRRLALQLGQPVRFALRACSHGQQPAGQVLDGGTGPGWVELPPLLTRLPALEGRSQARIEVELQARMTEVGTLEVRCVALDDPARHWQLAFAVRGAGPGHDPAAPDGVAAASVPASSGAAAAARWEAAQQQIDRIFGEQPQDRVDARDVRQLRQALEKILGPRQEWPLALLRALFDALLARARRRRRSAAHERSWLNLAGWCLRPGLGAALDDWRLAQVWALYPDGLAHRQDAASWTEWWVFWRRVAAGLDEPQQMQLLEAVAEAMQQTVQRASSARRSGASAGAAPYGSYDDMLRLFAAMEAVPWAYRQEMGEWMLQRLKKPGESVQTWWAIGRLAARQPFAANAHRVMPPEAADAFLQATLAQDWRHNEVAMFAAVQIARMTGDRALDLGPARRQQVLAQLRAARAPARWIEQVEQVQALDAVDQQRSLGDSLPPGLVLL